MQNKRRKKKKQIFSVQLLLLLPLFLACVILVIIIWPSGKNKILNTEHKPGNTEGHLSPTPTLRPGWEQVPDARESAVIASLGERVVFFEKKDGMRVEVLEDDYAHGRISICISGLTSDRFSSEQLKCVYDGTFAAGKTDILNLMKGGISDFSVSVSQTEGDTYRATILLEEQDIYECHVSEDEHYFFLDFYRPRELYDMIILLDAGHGTPDAGTSSANGVREKDLTLKFVQNIKALADQQEKVKFYYTRLQDERIYEDYSTDLHRRVDMANILEADLFLSIHFNAHESKKRNGTEAYYNEEHNDWQTFHSKQMASILLEKTATALNTMPNGVVPAATLYTVVKESKVPVTLLEMAYLSNENDLSIVTNEQKQESAARAVFNGLMESADAVRADRAAGTERYPSPTVTTPVTPTPIPETTQQ